MSPMRYCAVICLFAALAFAADTSDPLEQSRRIDEQLKKLDESTPIAQEMKAISRQIDEAHQQTQKQAEGLYEQMQKLRESEAWKAYEQKQRDLQAQRQDKWEMERKAMAEAARTLYAARHEEIRALARPDVPEARKLGFDVLTYPVVDGSTSTHPLAVIIASRFMGVPYQWVYPEPAGYPWPRRPEISPDRYLPVMAAGSAKMGENLDFHIAALRVVATPAEPRQDRIARMINSLLAANSSTHDAYVNLINRKCDLNLTARAPSADELKLAGEKGVKIELTPIAQDALVFIVNHKNPVRSLSADQVRDIYDGKIKTWKELGGEDKPIRPLRRETNSGSRELFDALVMKNRQLPEPESAWASELYSYSMAGPFNRVTQDDAALGYSVYYYDHFMAASPYTRIIAIDGVEPSAGTIGSGKYPWISPVYAACRAGEPADSPGMRLLAWLTGPEGQSIVREAGYVPAKAVPR